MNKAFMREPEPDGRAYCPKCQSLGDPVQRATLDQHLSDQVRGRFGNDGWFCSFADCDVAYFDLYDRVILATQLRSPVYPKSDAAPICACFGFTIDQLDAAIDARSPAAVRDLLAKSKTSQANCAVLAANGRCCIADVQRLYIRGVS